MTSFLSRVLAIPTKFLAKQQKGGAVLLSFAAPYLLLVSGYTGNLLDFNSAKIKAVNNSPYDGVAVSLVSAYETKAHNEAEFDSAVAKIKRESTKQIWPWVYLNRIIGTEPDGVSHPSAFNAKAFATIHAFDLDNRAAALAGFYQDTQLAARIARKLSSPGIMIDLEAYNNYKIDNLNYLAARTNRSTSKVKSALLNIGANLADDIAKEYPDATVWFTFTALGEPRPKGLAPPRQSMSTSYVAEGMLARIEEKHYRLTVVTGGMVSTTYCYESLDQLRLTILRRQQTYQSTLNAYPALKLGGTIALWKDAGEKKPGYFTKGNCGKSPIQNLAQFEPYLKQLFASYSYVYIYSAGMVNYNPYNAAIAADYNKAIRDALK